MHAYWFFMVYVSPILLILCCAHLAWRAFTDSRKAPSKDKEEATTTRTPGESETVREPWAEDPDAWKRIRPHT